MKVFKRVYFSAMAVLAVVAIVLSFVIGASGSYKRVYTDAFYSNIDAHLTTIGRARRNEFNTAHYADSRDYIANTIASNSARRVDDTIDEEDNKTLADVAIQDGKPFATLVVQTAVVLDETQRLIPFEDTVVSAARTVNNIIVYLPGTVTKDGASLSPVVRGDAVLFTAHYDSVAVGATDNAAAVAAMIESIRYIQQEDITHENDLVFVFTDAKENGALGAFTFMNQFKGFNNVVDRIKVAVDFSSMGASSKLMLVDSSVNDANLLKALKGTTGVDYSLNSIINYGNSVGNRISDFDAFKNIQALGFANVGETQKAKTSQDVVGDVSKTLAYNVGNLILSLGEELGSYDLESLQEGTGAVYFNYLGLNVSYSNYISYALAGVILLLLALVLVLNKRKNSFDIFKSIIGLMVQALAIVATIVALFACYFVTTLLLAGFGVVPINTIASIIYCNPAIILLLCVLSGAIMSGLYIVLKKAFAIDSGDVVRGNMLLWSLLGIIFGFAIPKLGYVLIIGAILQLIVTIGFVLGKEKYNSWAAKNSANKSRLGGIGGLFLYAWAAILTLPLVFTIISISASYIIAVLLPLLAALLMGLLGTAVPYADYAKVHIDKLFEKLPKRKYSRKVKVVERQEDRAKKGKFSNVEVIKKEVVTVDRKYTHGLGIMIVGIVCIISLIFATAFRTDFNTNLTNWKTIDNTVYDGAIVYEWSSIDGEVNTNLVIADPMAYKYATNYIRGYKWDAERGVYTKEINDAVFNSSFSAPTVSKNGEVITVSVYEQTQSRVILTLEGVSGYSSFLFSNGTTTYEYANTPAKDTIVFKMPRGFGGFTISLTGASSQVRATYEESLAGNALSDGIEDVLLVRDGFEKSGIENDDFKSGIVLRYVTTL